MARQNNHPNPRLRNRVVKARLTVSSAAALVVAASSAYGQTDRAPTPPPASSTQAPAPAPAPGTPTVAGPTATAAPTQNAPTLSFTPIQHLDDNLGWYEIIPTINPEMELDDIYAPHTGTFDVGGLESPLNSLVNRSRELEAATGLRLGMAYTMVFQQASAGAGVRSGTSGDLDFMADWTFLGRGTADTGRLVFTTEYRFKVGANPASAVGPGIGALTNTTGGFNDRGWAVRDVFYTQRLFDDHFRFQIGRFDISDSVGAYRMQNINNSFSNRAFSALATASFPGHGAGAMATVRPSDKYYVTAGATNSYGNSTTITIDELFENWDMFYSIEAGYTPMVEGAGRGRYAIMYWYVDGLQSTISDQDQGFALIAEQDIGESFYAFGRYQYADNAVQNIDYSVQIGLGINGLLGSRDNVFGAAFSYAEPAAAGARDEKVIEVFQRWQLTSFTQFSVGAQFIFDPSNAPLEDSVAVLTCRFRIAF